MKHLIGVCLRQMHLVAKFLVPYCQVDLVIVANVPGVGL